MCLRARLLLLLRLLLVRGLPLMMCLLLLGAPAAAQQQAAPVLFTVQLPPGGVSLPLNGTACPLGIWTSLGDGTWAVKMWPADPPACVRALAPMLFGNGTLIAPAQPAAACPPLSTSAIVSIALGATAVVVALACILLTGVRGGGGVAGA